MTETSQRKTTIGNVVVAEFGEENKERKYADGAEEQLLEWYKDGLSEDRRREILHDPDLPWPIQYHLAYERANLLDWYTFESGSTVLELGSGCGAVTESLVKNDDISIVSNELSPIRAMVNAYRNKDARNLEVAVGNIQDYKPADKFDYVVCIGVLEYSGTFIDDPYPYKRFLELVRSFVCDGGTLLLAIENKFGLKYLSGTAEDHLGSTFTGINDYIGRNKIRTFSRTELIRLMEEAGFESPYFYYPHPDYKLPKVVYSDDYYPNEEIELPRQLLPAPGWGINREQVFSEMLAMNSIENLGIFPAIANSFLVEVKAQS